MCFISHAVKPLDWLSKDLAPCVCREVGRHCACMTCPKLPVITTVTCILFTTVSSVQLTPFGGRCWVRVEETSGESGKVHSLLLLWAVLHDIPSASTGEQRPGDTVLFAWLALSEAVTWVIDGTPFPQRDHMHHLAPARRVWQAAYVGVQAWLWVMVISLLSPAGSCPSPSVFFFLFSSLFHPLSGRRKGKSTNQPAPGAATCVQIHLY